MFWIPLGSEPAKPSLSQTHGKQYDYLLKILLIGEAGVGKSTLMTRMADDLFFDKYATTNIMDFRITWRCLFGKIIKLQIWDPEPGTFIDNSYYRGAHGIMILYEASDPNSLLQVSSSLQYLDSCGCKDVNKLIVASKCDLERNKNVEEDLVQNLAKELGIIWMQTSAKNSHNTEECFVALMHVYYCK